ncbi:teichoic acid transporter [Rhizobium sp. Leaf371]|uniref:oligosaccharide flippase family protein n=1 Tax=Rhizobium sp. Leaf371 TaxID=1736355 RepID=UPI000715271C|nr:oligosaccharide flippase family protein [Rhizobium sp. Leaf371]KQS61265.1 teichoic acid transporter [Rhizobium sp. Leaf371]
MVLRASGWSMGGYVLGQILRILSNLVLTRLLVPEVFGVMAVATMVLVVITLLSDVGLRQAVIQSPNGNVQSFLDTAWTLQMVRGVLIWLICIGVGIAIDQANVYGLTTGGVYQYPDLSLIIGAVGFAAVIMGFQSTKAITRARNLDLSRLTIIEFIALVISLVVAILLCWATGSIWSFVISSWVNALVLTVLSHTSLPGTNNRVHIDRKALGEMMSFGRWIMLASTFSVLAANGDRLLLAGWVTPTVLGFYVLAFNLVAMIEGAGGRLFSAVATPALSRVARETPEQIRKVYYNFRLPFDLFFVGSAGALYGGGRAIIDLLYDHRYAEAGLIIEILSFSLLVTRFGVASSVYLAAGRPQNLTILSFVKTAALFTLVPLANWLFGFEGALWAIALHGVLTLPILLYFNIRYRLNSVKFECVILLAWPVGYLVGHAFEMLVRHVSFVL